MTISGVYKIFPLSNPNKFYLGSSKNIAKRVADHFKAMKGGYHYNPKVQRAYNKYGEFGFETVELRDNYVEVEQILLDQLSPPLNISRKASGGDLISYHPKRDEICRKISESGKRENLSPETRRKLSEATRGTRNPNYGKKHSPETLAKISLARRGTKWTDEQRARLSKNRLGSANGFYGKTHSEETRRKISNGRGNKKPVIIDGTFYSSITEAVRKTGIAKGVIQYRLKSEHFQNYVFQ